MLSRKREGKAPMAEVFERIKAMLKPKRKAIRPVPVSIRRDPFSRPSSSDYLITMSDGSEYFGAGLVWFNTETGRHPDTLRQKELSSFFELDRRRARMRVKLRNRGDAP